MDLPSNQPNELESILKMKKEKEQENLTECVETIT